MLEPIQQKQLRMLSKCFKSSGSSKTAYSPDLSPCDENLIPKLKHSLHGI